MSWVLFAVRLAAAINIVALSSVIAAEWSPSDNDYHIPGGFFAYLGGNVSRSMGSAGRTCRELARTYEEPPTLRLRPRTGLTFPNFPRLAWRWDGPILRQQFEAVLGLRFPGLEVEDVVHYKILSGQLWVSTRAKPMPSAWFREHAEEMLTVAMYLFPDLPDMEFAVYVGDGCLEAPVFQWNICRDMPHAGFAMPTFTVWSNALGSSQLAAYHACLEGRYPPHSRIPRVVWRGSTTGVVPGPVNLENCMKLPRVQLHQLARRHPQLLDVGLYKLLQGCEATLKPVVTDLLESIPEEEYNKYCAILDVDGNGWSNRFVSTLVHYPTPVLKQASNATGAFEELYAPGAAIELFAPDLSDLLQRAAELVEDCRAAAGNGSARRSPGGGAGAGAGAGRGQRLAATMQATSRHLLDHVGIAEGWAYLLSVYAKLSYWRLNTSTEGFVKVDRRRCCVHAQLPPSLQADIRRWADMDGAQQQQGSAAAGAIVQGLGSVASLSVRQLLLYLLLGGNTVLAVVALLLCARWRRNSAAR